MTKRHFAWGTRRTDRRLSRLGTLRWLAWTFSIAVAGMGVALSTPNPKTLPATPTLTTEAPSPPASQPTAESPAAPKQPVPAPPVKVWHPKHMVKVWKQRYRGVTFQVVQLPRCEHIETLITYDPGGETLKRAKTRMGGITAMTGSFHNPRTLALADFLQRNGSVISARRTTRPSLVIDEQQRLAISQDYPTFRRAKGVSALTLGQRLLPLHADGFSRAFMNQTTERMGFGMGDHYMYIVSATSSIWRLSEFFDKQLPCNTAVNSDGGHVVHGQAPVHVVFRWKKG